MARRRNANGTGNLYYDEKRNLYIYRVTENSKPKAFSGRTQESALEKYEEWDQFNGLPMLPRTVTHYWIDFRKKYNLPHVTFHGLRHTSATISIADGADIVSVSARCGHADASTTLRITPMP